MEISELQISQVNKQIEALIKAESFYGKKLEEAGITRISTPEDFKKLPFSEKKDLSLHIDPIFIHCHKFAAYILRLIDP